MAAQFRRLYSGTTADDAEELNFLDAAQPSGVGLVEPTPVSSRFLPAKLFFLFFFITLKPRVE